MDPLNEMVSVSDSVSALQGSERSNVGTACTHVVKVDSGRMSGVMALSISVNRDTKFSWYSRCVYVMPVYISTVTWSDTYTVVLDLARVDVNGILARAQKLLERIAQLLHAYCITEYVYTNRPNPPS